MNAQLSFKKFITFPPEYKHLCRIKGNDRTLIRDIELGLEQSDRYSLKIDTFLEATSQKLLLLDKL